MDYERVLYEWEGSVNDRVIRSGEKDRNGTRTSQQKSIHATMGRRNANRKW